MTVYASTFGDIVNEVRDKLRLDCIDFTSGTDATRIKAWINQVYLDICTETSCLQTSGVAAMTAGAGSYVMPAGIVHVDEITLTDSSGSYPPLQQCSLDEILRFRQHNSATGPPSKYAVVGTSQIEFWPAARAGDSLTFWYSYLPDKLVNTGDVSLLPEPFGSKGLVYGSCIEAADFKNDMRLYFYYQTAYQQWQQKFQSYVNRRPGDYPAAFDVRGPGSSGYIPSDRSSDFWVTGLRG